MNAKPNSNLDVAFNRKPSTLGADARKQGGQAQNIRRAKEPAIKGRSSLTVSRRSSNR
jgi:hypothetical protein